MSICQYEFQFEDEFMEKIEYEISKLLNISSDNLVRKDTNDGVGIVLQKATRNSYMLFAAHKSSLMYLVIIRCDSIHENKIRKLLFEICEEMEDCYDEDHREEVVNVFGDSDTCLKDLEERYKISSLFDIDVS